jgi:Ca-activated chloride channel family protein
MRQPSVTRGLFVVIFFACVRCIDSQTNPAPAQSAPTYGLNIAVDEVSLTFHAVDSNGLPINDLKLGELSLLDNGRPPRRILSFQLLQDFPIRAGILMDTSESMEESLPGNGAIASKYVQAVLRQQTDQAFVMDFGKQWIVMRPWSSDARALTTGIRKVTGTGGSSMGGTAIFDAVFGACLYQFGKIDHAASGNFILLFSDGQDNASHVSLQEAVDMCQRTHTAIYSFRTDAKSSFGSSGPTTLEELASEKGGRVFHDNGSEAGIYSDLRIIEGNLRNQYRLVYKPAELKRDGSFHRIELKVPERVDSIILRSGYYAPAH